MRAKIAPMLIHGKRLRIAVIGHVEHVTIGRVPAVPHEGEIAHLESSVSFPGGGGGVTFHQLAKSPAEVLLFTAIGAGEAGREIEEAIARTGVRAFIARREEAHTRDIVMVTPRGERTIVVMGQPLQPEIGDPLPWNELSACDAVYFTARDAKVLERAREARLLVVTARRRPSLIESRVRADVVVGSIYDEREASTLADYPVRPDAVVMTAGAEGGHVETATGVRRFSSDPAPSLEGGAYGAGDSFTGALVYHLAVGLDAHAAASASARFGAAVLASLSPLEAQLALGR